MTLELIEQKPGVQIYKHWFFTNLSSFEILLGKIKITPKEDCTCHYEVANNESGVTIEQCDIPVTIIPNLKFENEFLEVISVHE